MTCPFRIDRKISLTMPGEFHDFFCDCVRKNCPCYKENGTEKWCYRDQIRLPLNDAARKQESGGDGMSEQFEVGEYIIYQNGSRYEIGKIKSIAESGAFVYYTNGDTAAKTPFECMHKLTNWYVIGETSLGGVFE